MEAAGQLVRGALRRSTAWREPGSSRDLRLDLLRGWCIVLIVLDHASGWAGSPFDRITGANAWLVTGTEGFVIVSGLTAGMVYGRVIVRRGLAGATLRLWRRAGFVYIAAVIGGLPPVLLALAHREGGEAVLDALGTALALRDTGIVAILYLWVALFLLAPLPIALLARGHSWLIVALGLTAIAIQAWRQAGGAVFDGTELASAETVRPLLLAFGLWTLAAAAGWNRARIAAAWRAGPALTAGACAAGLVALALVPDVVPAALLAGPDGPGQLDASTVVRSYAVVLAATALIAVLAWTLGEHVPGADPRRRRAPPRAARAARAPGGHDPRPALLRAGPLAARGAVAARARGRAGGDGDADVGARAALRRGPRTARLTPPAPRARPARHPSATRRDRQSF